MLRQGASVTAATPSSTDWTATRPMPTVRRRTTTIARAEADQAQSSVGAHAPPPASQLRQADQAQRARCAEEERHAQDPHLGQHGLGDGDGDAEQRDGRERIVEREPRTGRCVVANSPAPSTSMSHRRADAAHCRHARSRPAYSSSGPSCTIVSSRWVSGLSTGWRPVSVSATMAKASGRAPVRRLLPRRASRRRVAHHHQVGAAARRQRGEQDHQAPGRPRRTRRRSGPAPRP